MAKTTKTSVKNPVTEKLGRVAMMACRKAAKRANKVCEGTITPLICYSICSKLRSTGPSGKSSARYTHGIVDVSFFSRWLASRGLSVYVPDRKSTHSSSKNGRLGNDVDRLFHELERLGLVIRWKSTYRWGNLRTPGDRTVNDAKATSNELDGIAALFDEPAKPKVKPKAKRCGDCEMVLSECICEDDEEPEENEERGEDDDDDDDDDDDGDEVTVRGSYGPNDHPPT